MDSNDRDRVDAARDELHRMLNEDELRESILLVFANKQVRLFSVLTVAFRGDVLLFTYPGAVRCVFVCVWSQLWPAVRSFLHEMS